MYRRGFSEKQPKKQGLNLWVPIEIVGVRNPGFLFYNGTDVGYVFDVRSVEH